MISIVPYSGEYKVGVLAVLKRNFPWMARYSDEWLSRWLSPLIEYHWDDDPDISDVPFKYGAVVLDGDNVVGFFGTIYSYRLIDGKNISVSISRHGALMPNTVYIHSAR